MSDTPGPKATNASARFPILSVTEILDKTTLVVTGPGVDKLVVGDQMVVVAIGKPVGSTGAPLVIPKAELEVTSAMTRYAVLRSPEQEVEAPKSLYAIVSGSSSEKVRRRPHLFIDEKATKGNPAHQPIELTDVVVRKADLRNYGDYLAQTATPAANENS